MKNLVLLTLFLPFLAHAGSEVKEKTIKEISMGWAGEGVFIRANGSVTPVEGCSKSVFVLTPDTPLFEENFSLALSAMHAGSTVGFYVTGCIGENMKISAIRISG